MYHDLNTNKLLLIISLKKRPSAIQFSPDGAILIIGYLDSTIEVYSSYIEKKNVNIFKRQIEETEE